MNTVSNQDSSVIATLVPDHQRMNFLPRHFGPSMMLVESKIYGHLSRLSADYRGGYWQFYDLSNGGCYMAPAASEYRITAMNGYEGTVDADTAGIIETLYALSHLAFTHETEEIFATRFHQLREFALDHRSSSDIFAAID